MTKHFPTLYKLSDTGKIIEWRISVEENVIITRWGQEDGSIQETLDTVESGKNEGKKNATTPIQQALKEAKSKWQKQQKNKKYVATREAALSGQASQLIAGGVDVMLAHKYRDHSAKVVYPAYVQPKLDGIRCIAIVKGGKCELWSRTRKPITGVPHINAYLEDRFGDEDIILDGELYDHGLKDEFERITSFVRSQVPLPGCEIVQYHVYDIIDPNTPFSRRNERLAMELKMVEPVVTVETHLVDTEDEMLELFQSFLVDGYEGCMVRNANSPYEPKRSYNLQKVKEMQDAEFEIVGVQGGRGKMADKAIFTCRTKNGESFTCKMKGSLERLGEYFEHPETAVGKLLTVQFQNLTAYGMPRFPVGLRIREDM